MKLGDISELEELLSARDSSERSKVGVTGIKDDSTEFCANVLSECERQLRVVALDARKGADMYWVENYAAREEAGSREECYIGTRARLLNGALVLEWYKNTTKLADKSAPNGKRVPMSKYIRSGGTSSSGGGKFDRRKLGQVPEWAKETIDEVEAIYKNARKRAKILQAIKRNVKEYQKLVEQIE